MNFGELLHDLPTTLRSLIRKLEKENKKLITVEWSSRFNSICLSENLLPKFTYELYNDILSCRKFLMVTMPLGTLPIDYGHLIRSAEQY